jgi:hypothetical protein
LLDVGPPRIVLASMRSSARIESVCGAALPRTNASMRASAARSTSLSAAWLRLACSAKKA